MKMSSATRSGSWDQEPTQFSAKDEGDEFKTHLNPGPGRPISPECLVHTPGKVGSPKGTQQGDRGPGEQEKDTGVVT